MQQSFPVRPPKTQGLLESSLYVQDVPASLQFYQKIFGFPVIGDGELHLAFAIAAADFQNPFHSSF